MSIDISVAICTYNRADLLSGTLVSVCTQTLAPNRYEIIVVDNASTDNTAEVVREYKEKYPVHNLRRVFEPRQGTGHARNAVLKEAAGDYIAYLDDDARAKPDWLALACTHLESQKYPHCIGGRIQPFYTTDKPSWFKDQYESRTWGEVTRQLIQGESFSGSNMIWRKETLLIIGGFGETMGPRGRNLSMGEDTIAFRRLWRLQKEPVVIYDPDMVVLHWVPDYKMKTMYVLKRAFVTGQAAIQLDNQSGLFKRLRTWVRSGGAAGLRLVQAAIRMPRYPRWQHWIVEECVPVASKLGTCLAACGIMVTIKQE